MKSTTLKIEMACSPRMPMWFVPKMKNVGRRRCAPPTCSIALRFVRDYSLHLGLSPRRPFWRRQSLPRTSLEYTSKNYPELSTGKSCLIKMAFQKCASSFSRSTPLPSATTLPSDNWQRTVHSLYEICQDAQILVFIFAKSRSDRHPVKRMIFSSQEVIRTQPPAWPSKYLYEKLKKRSCEREKRLVYLLQFRHRIDGHQRHLPLQFPNRIRSEFRNVEWLKKTLAKVADFVPLGALSGPGAPDPDLAFGTAWQAWNDCWWHRSHIPKCLKFHWFYKQFEILNEP